MEQWMKNSVEGDVQTAIQTQTIQTVMEQNSSKLSDVAFQSYLTNAPIPRMFYTGNNSTFTAAANVTAKWLSVGAIDPYTIQDVSTGLMTIPIDGFYTGNFWIQCTSTAGGSFQISWMDSTKTIIYGTSGINDYVAAAGNYMGSAPMLYPFRAGSKILVNIGNNTATTLAFVGGNNTQVSLVWTAPFNQYTGGN